MKEIFSWSSKALYPERTATEDVSKSLSRTTRCWQGMKASPSGAEQQAKWRYTNREIHDICRTYYQITGTKSWYEFRNRTLQSLKSQRKKRIHSWRNWGSSFIGSRILIHKYKKHTHFMEQGITWELDFRIKMVTEGDT